MKNQKKVKFEKYEGRILSLFLCELYNWDAGLNREERAQLKEWIGNFDGELIGVSIKKDEDGEDTEPHFGLCQISGLRGDVFDIEILIQK